MDRVYLLDTNVFIEASRRYYSFDIAPTFWKKLIIPAKQGKIITIDKVENEINKGKDLLSDWFKKNFSPFVKSTKNEDVLLKYAQVINWVDEQGIYQFSEDAKNKFFENDKADAWLIAYALANDCVIVTHEEFKKDIKKKVPIPNVCREFGIDYINTFEMMRILEFKL